MKIFLIRHGQSMQNTKENYKLKLPDNKVYLTDLGRQQADDAGNFLRGFVDSNGIDLSNAYFWKSPFDRTRETADIINRYLNIEGDNYREDPLLIEERYGKFSDEHWEDIKVKYPVEYAIYDNYYRNDGKFYIQKPMGDAPLDVYVRAKLFTDTIFRDMYFDDVDTHFVVTHGSFIKCFLMGWEHHPPEWFGQNDPIDNCEIIYINRERHKKKSIEKIYRVA